MLSEKMTAALNDQITKEFYSSYLYLQMAAWFENKSLPGMANWMTVQAQEESSHAMIFFNYVVERGDVVELGAIDKPDNDFSDPLDVFKKVLAHEQIVTASINNLMAIAEEERDYATRARLTWFIDEQVEEESNANDLIGKLQLVGSGNGLFMIDKELSARTFVLPAPLAGGA